MKKINTITILVLTFLYLITYSIYDIIFDEGDDIRIQQIVQGDLFEVNDVHLVFINVVFGYLLKILYLINNSILWYSIIIVFLQFLSFFVILKNSICNKKNIFYILTLLIIFQYFIIRVQFTSITALLVIASYILIDEKIKKKSNNFFLPCLLISISFILRSHVTIAILFFTIILLVLEHKEILLSLIKRKENILQIIILFFVLLSSFQIDKKHYTSEKWQHYKKYNELRARIYDNPNFSDFLNTIKNEELKSDLLIFRQAISIEKFDIREMNKIEIKLKELKNYYLNSIFNNVFLKHNLILLFLLIFFSIVVIIKKKYNLIIPIIIFLLFFLYISNSYVFKNRISWPYLLLFYIFYIKYVNITYYKYIFIFFISILIYGNKTNIEYYKEWFNVKSNNYPKDKPIVSLSGHFTTLHPFKIHKNNYKKNFIEHAWFTNSPLLINKLKNKNILVNNHFSLYDNKNLNKYFYYFINDQWHLELYEKNLKHKNLILIPLKNYKNFYLIKSKNNTNNLQN